MANRFLVLLFSIFGLVSLVAVEARPGLHFHPCNTYFVSTFSFSLKPRNPNFVDDHHLHHHRRPEIFAVVTELRDLDQKPDGIILESRRFFPNEPEFHRSRAFFPGVGGKIATHHHEPQLPLGVSSLHDRTMDILSVVASLLFGAACGALTAGTMYLIWSIFYNRQGEYRSMVGYSDDEGDDDDDDIFNPKKNGGYVAVPAAATPADSAPTSATATAAPVKETV